MEALDKESLILRITQEVLKEINKQNFRIPIGVSNRHVHLSAEDRMVLFGENVELTKLKDLKQPGQYACNEVVTIKGPKGEIKNVRILGPDRKQSQVEIAKGDSIKLGVKPEVRESGDLKDSAPIMIIGPKGSLYLNQGVIIAKRHIHMTSDEALKFDVHDGQVVSVKVNSSRGGIYDNVTIRAGEKHSLEFHLDVDEANAMLIDNNTTIEIIK